MDETTLDRNTSAIISAPMTASFISDTECEFGCSASRSELFQGGQIRLRLRAGDGQPFAEWIEIGKLVLLDRAANHELVASAVQRESDEPRVRRNAMNNDGQGIAIGNRLQDDLQRRCSIQSHRRKIECLLRPESFRPPYRCQAICN
jgi:hypothetical protein